MTDMSADQIIRDMVDPEQCRFDHHGFCQEHYWFTKDSECPHARAKRFLADWDRKQQEDDDDHCTLTDAHEPHDWWFDWTMTLPELAIHCPGIPTPPPSPEREEKETQ